MLVRPKEWNWTSIGLIACPASSVLFLDDEMSLEAISYRTVSTTATL